MTTGRKHSEATKAKMSAAQKAWKKSNPEAEAARVRAVTAATQTPEYIAGALARYHAMQENGTGICSDEVRALTADAAKWVMKKAAQALRLDAYFIELWTETQHRLRREMPYDGPQGTADYFDYLQKLGRALLADPAIKRMQSEFMKDAIPRFYAEWTRRRDALD